MHNAAMHVVEYYLSLVTSGDEDSGPYVEAQRIKEVSSIPIVLFRLICRESNNRRAFQDSSGSERGKLRL